MCCMYTVYSGMQEWVIQIPSIPILVSVLFPSLHLKYFRIKFLLLVNNENEERALVKISKFLDGKLNNWPKKKPQLQHMHTVLQNVFT